MTVVYIFLIFLLSVYSYVLVDPNLTLINNDYWTQFRNAAVNIGYFQRGLSSNIYISVIVLLFLFHFILVKKFKELNPIKIAFLISLVTLFAYPFLSHDFFNYMFDAKILTFYHQNPYALRALDFPDDQWLRFMHWTHRTYPYGPVFLLITLVPSFLGFGKFLLSFVLFKLIFAIFYLVAVYFLAKLNKKYALIFATSPLVIVEGLVSAHNDLIAVSLAIVGIYYLHKKHGILSRIFLLLSGGIKYITLPLVFLSARNKKIQLGVFLALIGMVGYLSIFSAVQPWYFLSLLIFIPFYEKFIVYLNIFFAGLLFSYYPFIKFGDWSQPGNVILKSQIIIVFLLVNLVYFLIKINRKSLSVGILK